VRDATGEHAQAFELLRVAHLLLKPLPFDFRHPPLGDVEARRRHADNGP
jgi:hypothetical protein